MSAKDHPNHAPGAPMLFPPLIERLQIRYMNPVVRRVAPHLPGLAIVKHRGRRSGTAYETVVTPYRKGDVLAVALAHGKTNWVKNVLAAGKADVHLFRSDVHITNPRVLAPGTAGEEVPTLARLQGRRVALFVADIT
jgi:deazaflavin-dependent oxidoreductase (nitroreductase family)